jgi:hypothetical protein
VNKHGFDLKASVKDVEFHIALADKHLFAIEKKNCFYGKEGEKPAEKPGAFMPFIVIRILLWLPSFLLDD